MHTTFYILSTTYYGKVIYNIVKNGAHQVNRDAHLFGVGAFFFFLEFIWISNNNMYSNVQNLKISKVNCNSNKIKGFTKSKNLGGTHATWLINNLRCPSPLQSDNKFQFCNWCETHQRPTFRPNTFHPNCFPALFAYGKEGLNRHWKF